MGCCCSGDSLPDVPSVIKPDPPMQGPVKFVTKRMGMFGRDYSVHENVYPSDKEQVKEQMWLWLNKSNGGVIDLENFVRGKVPDQPDKGEVLYTAVVTERPVFHQVQRPARMGGWGMADRFFGFFGGQGASDGYDSDDDFNYVNSAKHTRKFDTNGRRRVQFDHHNMITKWSLNTQATIRSGNTGRAVQQLNGQPIILEVFSKGTCATGWEDRDITTTDDQGRQHTRTETRKIETEWVDRVEYRLSCGGMFWASWVVPGDTHYQDGTDTVVQTPLCTSVASGGWFKASLYEHTTNPGVDPALALLIHHLCLTEYSAGEIKKDLVPNTPRDPPHMFNYMAPQQSRHGGMNLTAGNFRFG